MLPSKIVVVITLVSAYNVSSASPDSSYPVINSTPTYKSRMEVLEELKAAQANGSYVVGGTDFDTSANRFTPEKTREEVMAELEQSKHDGSYARLHREFHDRHWEYHSREPRTRFADISGGDGSQ